MKKTDVPSKLFRLLGAVALVFTISGIAEAQGSAELSCRTRAKELAAETYKGCMTDVRQTQIDQIRRDYKEKLNDLKSHYDKELKKLSSNAAQSSEDSSLKAKYDAKKAKLKQRVSGARMPLKKSNTQVLDFTTPAIESQTSTKGEMAIEEETQVSRDSGNDNEIEVVELPTQQ